MKNNKKKITYLRYYQSLGFLISFFIILLLVTIFVVPKARASVFNIIFLVPFIVAMYIVTFISFSEALKERKFIREMIENDKVQKGVIYCYTKEKTLSDDGNNDLVAMIRYYDDDGLIKETFLLADTFCIIRCPEGTCVDFIIGEDTRQGILLGRSDKVLSNKDELLSGDIKKTSSDVARRTFVSCPCSECGAILMVAKHRTKRCPYCGNLVFSDDISKNDDTCDASEKASNELGECVMQTTTALPVSYEIIKR